MSSQSVLQFSDFIIMTVAAKEIPQTWKNYFWLTRKQKTNKISLVCSIYRLITINNNFKGITESLLDELIHPEYLLVEYTVLI